MLTSAQNSAFAWLPGDLSQVETNLIWCQIRLPKKKWQTSCSWNLEFGDRYRSMPCCLQPKQLNFNHSRWRGLLLRRTDYNCLHDISCQSHDEWRAWHAMMREKGSRVASWKMVAVTTTDGNRSNFFFFCFLSPWNANLLHHVENLCTRAVSTLVKKQNSCHRYFEVM